MTERPQFLAPEPPSLTDPATARAVVLPLPLEKSTSYRKGASRGPEAIVEASTQVEFFDAELALEPCSVGIHTDWELGDPRLNELPVTEFLERIRRKTRSLLEKGKFVLALGGEHTITVGLIDPYLERYGDSLTVVQIDAHADLKDQYQGNPFSHACVMRRLLGRVPIVGAGIRSVDPEEFDHARPEKGYRAFYAHEIRSNPAWIRQLLDSIRTPNVYLTVDVDGLDPSILPSTGTPEPGGLGWWETLDLIRGLSRERKIVGADVNELAPGPAHHADFTTAKLCYKILGYSFFA
jgi:agmatinase